MSILELVRQSDPITLLNEPLLEPLAPPVLLEPLTGRELVVLDNLGVDITLEQIAAKLWVSRNTVKSQVRSLYRKIGVSTRVEAVAWAEASGLR